jgi:hypothetical protein
MTQVISKRYDGAVDFYRGWYSYKMGFGNVFGEYYLGNYFNFENKKFTKIGQETNVFIS